MCVFNFFKYNNKSAHWVGHSKVGPLKIDEFFKRTPNFYEKEAIVTGKTEEEKNTAKKTTDYDDANVEDDGRIHKNKGKVVTIEEERNTLEYKETMNLYIEKFQ